MRLSNTWRAAMAAVVAMVCGCATYTSPFVHKTEEELDAMERLDWGAARRFASGDYDAADRTLRSLTAEPTVSRPLLLVSMSLVVVTMLLSAPWLTATMTPVQG